MVSDRRFSPWLLRGRPLRLCRLAHQQEQHAFEKAHLFDFVKVEYKKASSHSTSV